MVARIEALERRVVALEGRETQARRRRDDARRDRENEWMRQVDRAVKVGRRARGEAA
jgi:hypothetical protein